MKKISKILFLSICIFSAAPVFAMQKPSIGNCCEGCLNDSIEDLFEYLEDEAAYLKYIRSNEDLANVEEAMKEIWEVVETWYEYTDAYTSNRPISSDSIETCGRQIKAILAAHNL